MGLEGVFDRDAELEGLIEHTCVIGVPWLEVLLNVVAVGARPTFSASA